MIPGLPEIPEWVRIFVIAGIGLLLVVVPLRVFAQLTRGSRERLRRMKDLAERLKGRFGDVAFEQGVFVPHRIRFSHEGRPAAMALPDGDELAIRLEPKVAPRIHALVRTRGRWALPFAVLWESLRVLGRVRTHDPLIDDGLAIYASPVMGGYLRDLALDGVTADGKASGLAESLVVLRRMPGVRRFELRVSPSGGFRVHFRLSTEDLIYRPEELESAVHHAFRLYDLLVLY